MHSSWQHSQHINNWHHKIIHKCTIDILRKSLACLKLPYDRNVTYQHNILPKTQDNISFMRNGRFVIVISYERQISSLYEFVSIRLFQALWPLVLPHFFITSSLISNYYSAFHSEVINTLPVILIISFHIDEAMQYISTTDTTTSNTYVSSFQHHHHCLVPIAQNKCNCYITPF